MKKNTRPLFISLAAAAFAVCAPGRGSAQQVPSYVPSEQSETSETAVSSQPETGPRTEPGHDASGGAHPAITDQPGTRTAPTKPNPGRSSSPFKNPDLLYSAKQMQERIPTHCGTPTKVPKKAPNGLDAIDLSKVLTAKGVPITNWPITSQLSSVSFGRGEVCTPHSKSGRWPLLDFFGDKNTKVEGNMWIFAFINGRWVGGAGHWLRPGQTCKGTNLNDVGPDLYYDAPPLRTWSPCHGELVGFAVSTPARAGQWGTAERSNVHLIRWP